MFKNCVHLACCCAEVCFTRERLMFNLMQYQQPYNRVLSTKINVWDEKKVFSNPKEIYFLYIITVIVHFMRSSYRSCKQEMHLMERHFCGPSTTIHQEIVYWWKSAMYWKLVSTKCGQVVQKTPIIRTLCCFSQNASFFKPARPLGATKRNCVLVEWLN